MGTDGWPSLPDAGSTGILFCEGKLHVFVYSEVARPGVRSDSAAAFACLLAAAPCSRAASLGPGDIRGIDNGVADPFESVASDINNAGIVIGAVPVPARTSRPPKAFLDPGFSDLPVEQLPPIDAHINFAGKIAKNGNAVAGVTAPNPPRVWYRPGAPGSSVYDAGTLGGTNAFIGGINSSGVFVGTSDTAASGVQHAFWHPGTPNGTMVDLGTLTGTGNSGAADINDAGVIVGNSTATHIYQPRSGSDRTGRVRTSPLGNLQTISSSPPKAPTIF